jgi:signal transduction histidine kinase
MAIKLKRISISMRNLQYVIYAITLVLTPLVIWHPDTYPLIAILFIGSSYFFSRKIRQSAELLNKVICLSPNMISIFDTKSETRTFINKQANHVMGVDFNRMNQITSEHFEEMIHPDDLANYLAGRARDPGPDNPDGYTTLEFRSRKSDGTYAHISSRVIPFERSGDGKVTQFLSISEDITKEKELAQELAEKQQQERAKTIHSERFTALSEMAGGIAHEINNPLAIIMGHTQTMRMRKHRGTLSDNDFSISLDKIEFTAKRISKVVNSMIMIANDGMNDAFIDCPINVILDDLHSFWGQRLANHRISLDFIEVDPEITVYCRPVQIVLVLLNLVGNSFHAIKDRDEKWIRVRVEAEGDKVAIHFTDSGKGIPESIKHKIFDPFFTTRSVGDGAGLGLSVASGIAKVHNGSLRVDSSSPNTSFVLSLPRGSQKFRQAS